MPRSDVAETIWPLLVLQAVLPPVLALGWLCAARPWRPVRSGRRGWSAVIPVLCLLLLCVWMVQLVTAAVWLVGERSSAGTSAAVLRPCLGVRAVSNGTAASIPLPSRVLAGEHDRFLSHVVVAFTSGQESKVRHQLLSWSLPGARPCSQGTLPLRAAGDGPGRVLEPPSLVLLVSGSGNLRDTVSEAVDMAGALHPDVALCFGGVAAVWIVELEPSEDVYPLASRLVFETLLLGPARRRRLTAVPVAVSGASTPRGPDLMSCVLLLEPDVVAVRDDWLAVLSWATLWPSPEYWVRGSLDRAPARPRPSPKKGGSAAVPEEVRYSPPTQGYLAHINGNALYQFGSEDFADYYARRALPWLLGTYGESFAFDAGIGEFNWHPDNRAAFAPVAHFFQFTDVVQNLYGGADAFSPWRVRLGSPRTALVHLGGH